FKFVLAFQNGIGYLGRNKFYGTYRIVIAGNYIIYFVRVAIRINNSYDRYGKPFGFSHGNSLFSWVYNKKRPWQRGHLFYSAQVLFQVGPLLLKHGNLFFLQNIEGAVFFHSVDLFQPLDALFDR